MSPKRNAPRQAGRTSNWAEVDDYQRTGGNRRQRGRLFIICEGKETEPLYFEAAWKERQKQNQVDPAIIVKPGKAKTYPTAVVKRAIAIKASSGWDDTLDQVYAVFDTEQTGMHPDLMRAIKLAKDNQVGLAISNPAIEYWFLLHFENTNRPFTNADQLCETLRRYIPDYSKSRPVYSAIRDRMEGALARAQQFRERSDQNLDDMPNPSTGVDNLIRRIFNTTIN